MLYWPCQQGRGFQNTPFFPAPLITPIQSTQSNIRPIPSCCCCCYCCCSDLRTSTYPHSSVLNRVALISLVLHTYEPLSTCCTRRKEILDRAQESTRLGRGGAHCGFASDAGPRHKFELRRHDGGHGEPYRA